MMHEKPHTPDSIHIEKRCIEHRFDNDISRYWANNNPVITAFFNALSTVIPEGERFFMRTVVEGAKTLDSPQLLKEVKGFVAQEGTHRIGHGALNDWVRNQGYPVEKAENRIKGLLQWVQKRFSPERQLASTVALEHFSSLLSDQFLRQKGLQQDLHPVMREFLIWHCIEENEHKAVAFDVYEAVSGNFLVRVAQQLFMTAFFVPQVFAIQFSYLRHDGELFNLKAWLDAVRYFWFSPGWFGRVIPGYLAYFKPRFHPWEHDNTALLQAYIQSPGQLALQQAMTCEQH